MGRWDNNKNPDEQHDKDMYDKGAINILDTIIECHMKAGDDSVPLVELMGLHDQLIDGRGKW